MLALCKCMFIIVTMTNTVQITLQVTKECSSKRNAEIKLKANKLITDGHIDLLTNIT